MNRIFCIVLGLAFLAIAILTVATDFKPQPTGVTMTYVIAGLLFFDKAASRTY